MLQRRILQLEMDGADRFFGEPAFQLSELLRPREDGRGTVHILASERLVQSPRLYSAFLLWLISELWEELPEVGDQDKPKLVFFFDEAHLLFRDAPKELVSRVEQVVRLIRSKGVGVYFITQTPKDVPADVLAQLGNRVQHALRAHTPDDEAKLKATVRTFPKTDLYDLQETLTSLGIGEAVVTGLDPRGVPTPVVACRLIPPAGRMAPLTPEELQADIAATKSSQLAASLRARLPRYPAVPGSVPVHRIATARLLAGASQKTGPCLVNFSSTSTGSAWSRTRTCSRSTVMSSHSPLYSY